MNENSTYFITAHFKNETTVLSWTNDISTVFDICAGYTEKPTLQALFVTKENEGITIVSYVAP